MNRVAAMAATAGVAQMLRQGISMRNTTLTAKLTPGATPTLAAGNVLIVEDDGAVREGLARALTAERYAVQTAPNGAEAIRCHADAQPLDTLLLDLDMPDQFRWQAVRRLGAANPQLTVIGMTKREFSSSLALEAELEAVVQKPFEIPALLQLLKRAPALTVS